MPSDLAAELTSFVKAAKVTGGVKCKTCSLPKTLLEAIEAEHAKNGTPMTVLAKFVRSKGFTIADTSIRGHFHSHVQ